jgi:hypothetical protein
MTGPAIAAIRAGRTCASQSSYRPMPTSTHLASAGNAIEASFARKPIAFGSEDSLCARHVAQCIGDMPR